MKKFKFIYLSILLVVFSLVSCENTDPIVDTENPNQSASARTAMQELQRHYNDDGSLNNANNPVGNIVFDYCFDFQLPITLSYNTGATVVINESEDLINVLISMTDELYIDGIVFPFNVVVFDETIGDLIVRVISNEQEFVTLIESCSFGDDDCVCPNDYAPVCVEMREPAGESMTVEFPNACFAACAGFTENDYVDCDVNTGDCVFENLVVTPGDCNADGTYSITINFEYENTGGINYFDVLDVSGNNIGYFALSDLPVTISSFSGDYISVNLNDVSGCSVGVDWDAPDCNTTTACWDFVYPVTFTNGTGESVTVNERAEFDAQFTPSTGRLVYPFSVVVEGETIVVESPNNFFELGEFENMCD